MVPSPTVLDAIALSVRQGYPPEQRYVRQSVVASIGAHLLVATIVLILAYLNGVKNLRDFMRGAPPMPPPPPPEDVEVVLVPDDTPPPPTLHPEFIIQKLVQPKPPPPIVPPVVKPKPHPVIPRPKVKAAPPAVITSNSNSSASHQLVVGSGDLPQPQYPQEAEQERIQGTVMVTVTFDSSGSVDGVQIVSSSGSRLLDTNTRQFIMENWHDPQLAGQTGTAPVIYQLH